MIGASNREDMIDPAILRPGRLDVKIRIERPDFAGCLDIIKKYLTARLPLSDVDVSHYGGREEAVEALQLLTVKTLFAREPSNEYLEVFYATGERETLYIADFVSGAMLAAIVDRAKKLAIKDLLTSGRRGIRAEHLVAAVRQEVRENEELATITNPDEWARVNGRSRGERITMVRPLSQGKTDGLVPALLSEDNPHVPAPGKPRHVNQWDDVIPEGLV